MNFDSPLSVFKASSTSVLRQLQRSRLMRELEMPRTAWAAVLGLATVLALLVAVMMERLGIRGPGVRPLTFVSALICVKYGLFALWPALTGKANKRGSILRAVFTPELPQGLAKVASQPLKLWGEPDMRLQQSLFAATVPTFFLNNEQCFLDWNPAFALIFAGPESAGGLRRGMHVKDWYARLDNYRRVPKRTDQLYGEGILPITDRERVTFLSAEFGRMVFSRIMAPMIDRATGRIVGWSVVLNINSVNKRLEFFERLHGAVSAQTRRIRYASSYDGLFTHFHPRKQLLSEIVKSVRTAGHILHLNCGTGALTASLLGEGHRVTAVDGDTHLLRVARERCEPLGGGHLVRCDLGHLDGLPAAHYDAVVLTEGLQVAKDPQQILASIYQALRPGGALTLVCRDAAGTVDTLFAAIRESLEQAGRYDQLKHQLSHVQEFSRELEHQRAPQLPMPYADVRELLTACGFWLESRRSGFDDGHSILLVARK